jgi:hypothetical protein
MRTDFISSLMWTNHPHNYLGKWKWMYILGILRALIGFTNKSYRHTLTAKLQLSTTRRKSHILYPLPASSFLLNKNTNLRVRCNKIRESYYNPFFSNGCIPSSRANAGSTKSNGLFLLGSPGILCRDKSFWFTWIVLLNDVPTDRVKHRPWLAYITSFTFVSGVRMCDRPLKTHNFFFSDRINIKT